MTNIVFSVCCRDKPNFSGGEVIGAAVQDVYSTLQVGCYFWHSFHNTRFSLQPTDNVSMKCAYQDVDFGVTSLNLILQRLDNCTTV